MKLCILCFIKGHIGNKQQGCAHCGNTVEESELITVYPSGASR